MIGSSLMLAQRRGFQVPRSFRLRASASASISRLPGLAGNRKTLTLSCLLKRGVMGVAQSLLHVGTTSAAGNYGSIRFDSADSIEIELWAGAVLATTAVFRDPASEYHVVVAIDTTQAVVNDRVKMWVNGILQTSFKTNTLAANYPLNYDTAFNQALTHYISSRLPYSGDNYLDGYLSEFYLVDGKALNASAFGEFDSVVPTYWKPKSPDRVRAAVSIGGGTRNGFGTNGFYLPFSDPTSTTTLVYDRSQSDADTTGNNWTANNVSLSAGATYDSMIDVLLGAGGNERGNYATMILEGLPSGVSVSNGNLSCSISASANNVVRTNFHNGLGWRAEIVPTSGSYPLIGVSDASLGPAVVAYPTANSWWYYADGTKGFSNVFTAYGASYGTGATIGVEYVPGVGLLFTKNGVSQGVAFTGLDAKTLVLSLGNGTGASTQTYDVNFGQRPFLYPAIQSAAKPLHTGNLPTPAILNPAQHHNAYTVTKSGNTNFTLDWDATLYDTYFEIKRRDLAGNWYQIDGLRGYDKYLTGNGTGAEVTDANVLGISGNVATLKSTLPDGVYLIRAWKAGLVASRTTNTSGSLTSTVSVNTLAAFSIVLYTGTLTTTGSTNVGHGLGVPAKFVQGKSRSAAGSDTSGWFVQHGSFAANKFLKLNTTDSLIDSVSSGGGPLPVPTSSVFYNTWNSGSGVSGNNYVAFVWGEVPDYSKFGVYAGNGSTDGPLANLGFQARDFMYKRTDSTEAWIIHDTSRDKSNPSLLQIVANTSGAEGVTVGGLDLLSNSVKLRSTTGGGNASGGAYAFAAFASAPFKYANAK